MTYFIRKHDLLVLFSLELLHLEKQRKIRQKNCKIPSCEVSEAVSDDVIFFLPSKSFQKGR